MAVTRKDKRLSTQLIYLSIAGFLIDSALLWLGNAQGLPLNLSHPASFALAFGGCAILQRYWRPQATLSHSWRIFLTEISIFLLILFMRGGILSSLLWLLKLTPIAAFFVCSAATWLIYLSVRIWQNNNQDSATKQQHLLIFIIGYSLLLRLVYLGTPELFYEEAYYWNYAKHLDISYLDHPPLVAFIIAFFTNIFGDNEFGVRFGAWLCWIITSIFFCRLIRIMFPQRALILQSMALLATLPIFFGTGWAMTPDAPLMACWAALLYFLYQALFQDKKGAWIGAGGALGLGMLAKYTIILVGVSTLIIVLSDRNARKWLFRPPAYYAFIIAILLFSPVIIWNYQHDWASFLYQSRSHVSGADTFALHYFLFGLLIILTPTAFVLALFAALLSRECYDDAASVDARRIHRNFMILGFVPIIVFAIVSISHETKLHWTGPAWLAILPFILLLVTAQKLQLTNASSILITARRAWIPTLLTCLILYGGFFHYVTLGFFKLPYPQRLSLLGWEEFGREMENVMQSIEETTGTRPLLVGMDRNRTASGLAFYINKALASPISHDNPTQQVTSWHLFERHSLMYEYWFPCAEQDGKNLLLVAKNKSDLHHRLVIAHVASVGEIKQIALVKNGQPITSYYYALAYGYHSRPLAIDERVIR